MRDVAVTFQSSGPMIFYFMRCRQILTLNPFLSLAAIALLLSACAVNKQGGNYIFDIDQSELLGTRKQEFDIGQNKAVLRQAADGRYQIKLYDRMKVIDMGPLLSAWVVGASETGKQDLILVNTPTPTCAQWHKVYLVNGYDVSQWDINNGYGDCSSPLRLDATDHGVVIRQISPSPTAKTWTWFNGRLTAATQSTQLAAGQSNGWPRTQAASAPAAGKLFPTARFESGEAWLAQSSDHGDTNTRTANAAPKPKKRTQPAARSNDTTAAPQRIDAGNYGQIADDAKVQVLQPVKIKLQDAN